MPSISNTARWYWTQYIEALEATCHGDTEHGVQVCLDLIVEATLPILLKALIFLHLATETSTRQYHITQKRDWIKQATEIFQALGDRPESQQANVEHLQKQIERAVVTVNAQERERDELERASSDEMGVSIEDAPERPQELTEESSV